MKPSEHPLTIFYTDDDPDDQFLFREVITEIDDQYDLYTQNHGGELMELLKNPPPYPHVVFLDLNMPLKNGYEVLREMRSSPQHKETPVIVFTTSDDKPSMVLTEQLGANMFVTKPSSYRELKKTLQDLLSKNWMQAGSNN